MAIPIPSLDYASAPTAEGVEVKIRAANWWPTDSDQIAYARYVAEVAIRGSAQRFLRLVRWEPFVASGDENEIRYFNKIDEQGRIMLGDGLLALTSITVLGKSYMLNDTVFLEPSNAATKGKPYTYLTLWAGNYGPAGYLDNLSSSTQPRELKPRSIVIIGKWGYATEWPEDAYEAILSRAAALTLSSINQESELSGISQDGYSEQYDLVGPVDQKKALDEWGKYFDSVAASYGKPKAGPMTVNTAPNAGRLSRQYQPYL